ncbi:MAG: metallophosphoesterase family protein [Bacteroidales bacterium]|nr:metallophosphoesterase family protein [Bacteroidales bacterium]MBN2697271.1 metallophosphoesterase family protein [Bacteroidales bacterium]
MFRIGLLSDTHGYLDDRLLDFFSSTDEIWHAGDIGDLSVTERLQSVKPVIAVFGNIDGPSIRRYFPLHQRLTRAGLDIWMTHIGGYPGRYADPVRSPILSDPPDLFISGHSHILKVVPDRKLGLLHINPGAAGRVGLHKIRTAVRFEIDDCRIKDLEIIELGQRSSF